MFVVTDIETNKLKNPDKIWVIVCREVESGDVHVFERPDITPDPFLEFNKSVTVHIGHNFLSFDGPCINSLIHPTAINLRSVIDTLVVSRLVNFSRPGGHSLESFGVEFGVPKIGVDISDFSVYNNTLKERCISDTYINLLLYKRLLRYINMDNFKSSLRTEHDLAILCNNLHNNGFPFKKEKAEELRQEIINLLSPLDEELISVFRPKAKFLKEVTPRETKKGFTLPPSATPESNLPVSIGGPVSTFKYVEFNPGSPKQIVERLNDAGWKPTDKTDGHSDIEQKYQAAYRKSPKSPDTLKLKERLDEFRVYGWKVNETNLLTLPDTAPAPAHKLSQRILLASRLSDLDEWLALATPLERPRKPVQGLFKTAGYTPSLKPKSPPMGFLEASKPEYVIQGSYLSIGSWTHRVAHQNPNLANIPAPIENPETDFKKYLSEIAHRMRSLFYAGNGRKLVGVDADAIQMRIFAHLINSRVLIDALVRGDKALKTDMHSIHQQALQPYCKSRQDAKTFIYAFLLGSGVGKTAEILGCSMSEAKESMDKFIAFYPGLAELKKTVIPADWARGYFVGLDGRYVIAPAERKILAGYLQNGEKVIMSRAMIRADKKFHTYGIYREFQGDWRNFVHDELQFAIENNQELIDFVANTIVESIVVQGDLLNLNCPLAAQAKIGDDWSETH